MDKTLKDRAIHTLVSSKVWVESHFVDDLTMLTRHRSFLARQFSTIVFDEYGDVDKVIDEMRHRLNLEVSGRWADFLFDRTNPEWYTEDQNDG